MLGIKELLNVMLSRTTIALVVSVSLNLAAFASDRPKTAEEFAARYMAAFNAKDLDALRKLRYPASGKSSMQEMIDEMTKADLDSSVKYSKFEILPPKPDMDKASMGPDGIFYKANLTPTNLIKLISQTKDGSSSTTLPIGLKDGVYYEVALEVSAGETPPYQFGWQRFSAPKSNWSFMLPNEPEPGRAAIEKDSGKDALSNPDIYGVIENTASIKTSQHWFRCGEEGKRVNDKENQETYRAAGTTYAPETLKEWFPDAKKNLDDEVNSIVRRDDGKLLQDKEISLAGSPGRELEIRNKDGSLCMSRIYWIKDALYELTFVSKKDKPDLIGANKFLSSLEVQ